MLDTFSRKIFGWSIDKGQNAYLKVNALDVTIKNRDPTPGVVVHADRGAQGEFNRSSQYLEEEVVDGQSGWMDGSGLGSFYVQ